MRKFLVYDVEASVNIIRSTQQVRALTCYFQPRHYVICEFITLQRFPAVTICNMSPFKASLVAKNEEISRILNSQHSSVRKRRAAAEPPPATKVEQSELLEPLEEVQFANDAPAADVSSVEVVDADEEMEQMLNTYRVRHRERRYISRECFSYRILRYFVMQDFYT